MPNGPQNAGTLLSSGNREDELTALVVLLKSKIFPLEKLAAEVEHFGPVETLKHAHEFRPAAENLTDEDVAAARDAVTRWQLEKRDIRTVSDPTYPTNLASIFNKPPMVFIKGTWHDEIDSLSVAVVGTRKPSQSGVKRAQLAARKLVKAGITVISGLAAGIDAVAHAAALDAGGRTVAVMGTGIDRIYPDENRKIAARILASGGALLSQFFPDQPPMQWTFPMRNVVMSGLSLATLVVEAGETSGARAQARRALEHGRTVYLPASLVRSHEWAKKMTETGISGTRAITVENVDEIVDRLMGTYDAPAFAVR